jgi:ribose transport system permease protein
MTAPRTSRTESIRRAGRSKLKPIVERWGSFSQTRVGSVVARAFSTNAAWIFLLLVALMFVFNFLAPGKFLTEFNVRSMAENVAVLLVIAVGETFVMATGGIDLSVGYVLLFSGVTSAQVMNWGGKDPTSSGWDVVLLGLVVAIGSGFAWGVLNGFIVAKAKVPALIATLGTLGMSWGLAEIFSNGQDLRYLPKIIADMGASRVIFDKVPLVVIVAVLIAATGAVFLSLTRFGRYTLAIGSNQEAARRAGINVDRHLIAVYALSGMLAGFAGFMSLAIFTTTTISGHANDNLQAIAAVVIGGTSLAGGVATIAGTTIGVCIPMVLFSGFTILGYQSFWRDVAVGAVLILAVYADQLRRRRRDRR